MSYTKLDLLQDLADMGLTGQETILIHSSMKSIGPVDGGADTVLDALMEFFRPGLLLLPTHTWRTINAANPVFDVCNSPAAWAFCRSCSASVPVWYAACTPPIAWPGMGSRLFPTSQVRNCATRPAPRRLL